MSKLLLPFLIYSTFIGCVRPVEVDRQFIGWSGYKISNSFWSEMFDEIFSEPLITKEELGKGVYIYDSFTTAQQVLSKKYPATPLKLCKLYSTPTQIQSWTKTIIPPTFSVHYDSFEITETNNIDQVGMVEYYLKKLELVGGAEERMESESDKVRWKGKGKGKGKGKKESEVMERAGVLVTEWESESGHTKLKLKLPLRYYRDITFRCYDLQSTFQRLLEPPIWSTKLLNQNIGESEFNGGIKGEEWRVNLRNAVDKFRVRKDGVVVEG